jgi:hypothetical protein
MHLISYSAITAGAFVALKTGVVIPLALACLVLVVVLPAAAWRGRLSVPIYALLALAAGAVAFVAGTLAGARSVHGTPFGVVVSIIFFLLVATAVGCFLSILFYRQPPLNEQAAQDSKSSLPPPQQP